MTRPDHVVAIPVHNESAHIGPCLRSLAGQAAHVLLLVNNTADDTVAQARAASCGINVTIIEREIAPDRASAGRARALAMDAAAARLAEDGVLLTTDADTRVAPDWIDANLFHLRAGCDAVAGRAVIDPQDEAALPGWLRDDDARECAYAAALDQIAALLDPDPSDPWPRHAEGSGASICVTLDAFRRAGGVPDAACGEDRAFFAALRRVDAVVRHAPEVWVTVSGRLEGRARGGMADTMRRRLSAPDLFLDDALEPAQDAVRRARLRARFRAAWRGEPDPSLARDLGVSRASLRLLTRGPCFGAAWEVVEQARLPRRRVPVADVLRQTAKAQALLAALRPARQTGRCDTSRSDDALSA